MSGTAVIQDIATAQERAMRRRWSLHRRVLVGLAVTLVCIAWLSMGIGAVAISPAQVIAIVLSQIGLETDVQFSYQQEMVLLAIRLPRVFLALLVGAGLSVCGAIMQGLFRNPLADPGLVGVTSGAAWVAVIAIVFSGMLFTSPLFTEGPGALVTLLQGIRPFVVPFAAFAGGMVATLLVYRLATHQGKTSVVTMLLAGIALNALASAGTGAIMLIADDAELRDISFWLLGSLGGANWTMIGLVTPFIIIGVVAATFLAKPLNALLLGEAEARYLGVNLQKVKKQVVWLTGLTVGGAVAFTGSIGFVGLVVPHLLRMWIGADHRLLIPGSAMLGGILLLAADLLARTIIAPAEMPIGIVTAFLGAPFFLWLLLKNRKTYLA